MFIDSWEDVVVEGCEEGKDCTDNSKELRDEVFPDCMKVGGNGRRGPRGESCADMDSNVWESMVVDSCTDERGTIEVDIST